MRNSPRISSFFFGNLSISKALYRKEKDDVDEKRKKQNKQIAAKNYFMGRFTSRIISSQPSRIGKSVRQTFYAAIGHLLKPGILLKIFDNLSHHPPMTSRFRRELSVFHRCAWNTGMN